MTGMLKRFGRSTAVLSVFVFLFMSSGAFAGPLPDTGQTKCYNNTAEIPCPAPGEAFYSQDGNYTINPPSYTRLDASGNALPHAVTSWTMIRDNVMRWNFSKHNEEQIHRGQHA